MKEYRFIVVKTQKVIRLVGTPEETYSEAVRLHGKVIRIGKAPKSKAPKVLPERRGKGQSIRAKLYPVNGKA